VEKLAKDLNSIMHEQQLYYVSGSSEEEPLYHIETPVGHYENGHGSGFLEIQTQNQRRKIGKQFQEIINYSLQVNHVKGS
jgi:hypothetical protein